MPTSVLICDDSRMARKQLARALPEDWDIDVQYAENGNEALAIIRAGEAEVTFLDLTMPEMDGYELLQEIRANDLPTVVIVVSGDVQAEAIERVRQLGALEFIRKPATAEVLHSVLSRYGLL